MIDGKVMGPYHHYCKPVSAEVYECLIYESTEPNALLKQVEYFVAKTISRPNVPLATWNKLYAGRGQEDCRSGSPDRRHHLSLVVAE
jgi:hypothetical protein